MDDAPKFCPRCHQALEVLDPLPVASRLPITYLGRNVYSVEGRPGLWIMLPWLKGGVELQESVLAATKAGKGRSGAVLYRQTRLEQELKTCL